MNPRENGMLLSLKEAIPLVIRLLEPDGEMLCLVKPLFEVADPQIRRTGIIDNPGIYRQILKELVGFTESIGLRVLGITNSPVTGNKGTKEFFYGSVRADPLQVEISTKTSMLLLARLPN
ncbi:MAG: hypothetical protein E6Z15_12115 [Paenibacillus macerans]|nr:hypothetical protein [Paenibacillus macerans]